MKKTKEFIMYESDESFTQLTPEQYRKFDMWIAENNQELYESKIAYEVRWGKDKSFYVRLLDESFITINDILLAK
tara:strand:+ start:992 stop:1216 length:225 start_codon:yes stop_codon:yes gene_type:complete